MKTLFFIITMLSSLLVVAQDHAPKEWVAWAQWAEKLHPITAADGHGLDIGSAEWADALAKRLGIMDAAGHGPDVMTDEWRAAVEKKLASEEKRKLLSAHDTVAKFEGIRDHRCMGLTSLCPDQCGHSGKLASFAIINYLNYEKPGEFGDPKQEQFQIFIEDNMKNLKVDAEIHRAILALRPGDVVFLKWNHDYVTREGASFPERTITRLEIKKK